MSTLRIAARYLRSKSSHSVVNIISRVSLWAIATPVAAVIILLSVFNGFGELVEDMASVIDAPLTLSSRRGQLFTIEDLDTASIRRVDGVGAISLVAEQTVLIRRGGRERIMLLRGVEPSYGAVTPLHESVTLGDSRTSIGDIDRVLLGASAAYQLGINSIKGGDLELYSIKRRPITSILPSASYNHRKIELGGLFSLDADSESRYAFTSLRAMQQLLQSEGYATHLHIGLREGADQRAVRRQIEEIAGEGFILKDRYEQNPTLYSIIKGEKRAIILISIFVMLLASFTLIGAVVMQILDKSVEITPLRSLGASMDYIRNIFTLSGVLIASLATVIGAVVGVVISLVQQMWGVVKIPAAGFLIDAYPVRLLAGDVLGVIIASMVLSTLLSVVVVRLTMKQFYQ